MTKEQPRVINIGLNEQGASVIRIAFPDGSIREAETNLRSFAKLAAMGIPVENRFHGAPKAA